MPRIGPFLWFDTQAEEAARFYVGVFPSSRIVTITRYGEAGPRPAGSVMTAVLELNGKELIANGGPTSSSTRRCPSPWIAGHRRRWTGTGA